MRKILSAFILATMLLGIGVFTTSASADTGGYVWMEFNSYGGNGFVNGGDNGQYYSLTPGNVHLEVTYTNTSSAGSFSVELRRKAFGYSVGYGSNSINGTGSYLWNIDNSGDYYLNGWNGSYTYTVYQLQGRMHDHG